MTEKRLIVDDDYAWIDTFTNTVIEIEDALDLVNKLWKENEKLKSVEQELRNELKFDEEMYKTFKEIIDEADDLITSHLSKHYQRQWKNFCKHRGVLDD